MALDVEFRAATLQNNILGIPIERSSISAPLPMHGMIYIASIDQGCLANTTVAHFLTSRRCIPRDILFSKPNIE